MKISAYWYLLLYLIHVMGNIILIKLGNSSDIKDRKQLPDIVLDRGIFFKDLIPYMDLLLLTFVIPLFLKDKLFNFITLFKFVGIMAFLRFLTCVSTLLPPIKGRYKKERSDENNLLNYVVGHNYDKIFSGHTGVMLICILITITNNLINKTSQIIISFLGVIYSILILLTRQHYTVDVLLSYMIIIPLYLCLKDII